MTSADPSRSSCVLLVLSLVYFSTLATSQGCSTHAKRVAVPRNLFYQGQLQSCREHLEKLSKSNRTDRDVVNLDLAIVDLLDGQPTQAESRLREVRDRFDHLEQDSLAEKTLSMWTDDQVRSYAGEDYEKILIRVYLALASMMHDGIDAESYSLQILDKHEQIMRKLGEDPNRSAQHPPGSPSTEMPSDPAMPVRVTGQATPYVGLPIGFYLRGVLREQTHHDYDDAFRSYSNAAALLPQCVPLQWDVDRVRNGVHSRPGYGVVYVFAMVGRGPYKVEVVEQPTSTALLIADQIISALGPYKLPPTIAPIKIPQVVVPTSDIDAVGVSINGQPIGPTVTLTDVEQLALSTFQASRNSIVARAVARRVIKKATIVAAKDSMSKDSLTSIGMDIAGIAWEATEGADTRCWGLLPKDIQVLRVEAPMGTHELQLSPLAGGQLVGPARPLRVHVNNGQNTYVMCWFPDARSASQVLCSGMREPATANLEPLRVQR